MIDQPLSTREAVLSGSDFKTVAAILHSEARISLSEGKISLVQSRLARRLRQRGIPDFGSYLKLVRDDAEERAEMVTALTTNHTHFFREKHHFDHLRDTVLPELKEQSERGSPVRIWSAGCSSGEEPYTIAMVLAGINRGDARWLDGNVRLLATDIAQPMVTATRNARYPVLEADQIPLPYRALWLSEEGSELAINPKLVNLVTARPLNLFTPWPFQRQFDVIFCRNVMIYFDADARADLEARLVAQLRPGGWLYIGHSERLSGIAASQTVCVGQTMYRKREQS